MQYQPPTLRIENVDEKPITVGQFVEDIYMCVEQNMGKSRVGRFRCLGRC
jgi:hypothetical protein